MTTQKTPAPTFEIQLKGIGIVPESVPLHHLSRLLSAVQRLASGAEDGDGEDHAEDDDEVGVPGDAIGLLKVKRGSAIYQCVAKRPKESLKNLTGIGNFVSDPAIDANDQFAFTLRPVQALSTIASALECDIIIRKLDDADGKLLSIDAQSFRRISGAMLVSGETTLLGRVQRVGGATKMRCTLRVAGLDKLLYCDVSNQDVSRQLGNKIYEDVEVKGIARWLQRSWRLYDFKVQSIQDAPIRKPLLKSLDALRIAGGKAWENIADPEAFLESMR